MTVTFDLPLCLQAEPTLQRYFESFNRQAFEETAVLFAPEGCLVAPFEEPVVGPEQVLAYLQREAAGMEAQPRSLEVTPSGEGRQIVVKGRVKAIVFNVNVSWIFWLDACDRIQQVRVKLLASLQELAQFRPPSDA